MEKLKGIKLFILDMDGTFYLGDRIIDGSLEFLDKLKVTDRQYLFFTNNSSKTGQDYIQKLEKMNCRISRNQIMTSGDVMIAYLNTYHEGEKVYLLGTNPLKKEFADKGIVLVEDEQPEVVVAAFDLSLTYEKLRKACTFIRQGAVFLATHLDVNCPIEDGFIPDCGAICSAISLSTGVKPKFVGKPFSETIDRILQETGYNKNEAAIVGDRLYTDIAAGVKNGIAGILVLSGETKEEDLATSDIRPTWVYRSLKDMIKDL